MLRYVRVLGRGAGSCRVTVGERDAKAHEIHRGGETGKGAARSDKTKASQKEGSGKR